MLKISHGLGKWVSRKKHLPDKYEDLNSNPQNHVESNCVTGIYVIQHFYGKMEGWICSYLFAYNYAHIHADAWGGQKKISYPLWLDEVKGNMDAGSQTRSPASAAITLSLWTISAALHKTFLIPMSSQVIFHCHVTFSQPQSLSYWSKPCVSISAQFWSS